MKNVLITGGTGLIGTKLSELLLEKGYSVSILSRSEKNLPNIKTYIWDVKAQTIDENAVKNADYIIHLAGKNIGDDRWTADVKKDIIQSRKNSTALLYDTIKKHNPNLKAFISSSAVGYYGLEKSEKIFTEEDTAGKDFLADVCIKWEENVEHIAKLGIRTAIIRTGVVLSKKGGALEQMALPVKLCVGAALGSGKQYIPWIHLNDICNLYLKAIKDESFEGIFNGVGDQHINNDDFTRTIAKVLKKPYFLPNIPSFLIKTALGERAVIALKGNKVSADKIKAKGYKHQYVKL
ncbi:MAG: TIGR01777 family oxidoreductase, partial [Chitinophagales bacterium]